MPAISRPIPGRTVKIAGMARSHGNIAGMAGSHKAQFHKAADRRISMQYSPDVSNPAGIHS